MSASVWISENNIKEWKYQKKPPYGNVYEWVKVPFSEEDLVNVTSCYKKTSSKKADYPKLDFKHLEGAGVRWTPLPKAEAPTEPAGETRGTSTLVIW